MSFYRQWHLKQHLTQPTAVIYCHSVGAAKTPEAKNCFGKGLYGWCACFLPLGWLSTPVNSRKEFIGERWGPGRKLTISRWGFSFTLWHIDRKVTGNAVAAFLGAVHSLLPCLCFVIIFVFFDHVCSGRQWTFFNLLCLVALRYCFITVR